MSQGLGCLMWSMDPSLPRELICEISPDCVDHHTGSSFSQDCLSLPFLPVLVWSFYPLLWRSCLASFQVFFRGNWFVCSCRFGVSVKGGWVQDLATILKLTPGFFLMQIITLILSSKRNYLANGKWKPLSNSSFTKYPRILWHALSQSILEDDLGHSRNQVYSVHRYIPTS